MKVHVNGEERELPPGTTVEVIVRELVEQPERGVAVALGGEVVPHSLWAETRPREGDEIEVLHAVKGG
jgi:sulfur carrier protein